MFNHVAAQLHDNKLVVLMVIDKYFVINTTQLDVQDEKSYISLALTSTTKHKPYQEVNAILT